MRKIYIVALLIISFSLFAIEYNQYEMERVHEFSVSDYRNKDENKLSVNNYSGGGDLVNGPSIYFDEINLVVIDQLSNRTIPLDDKYNFREIYPSSFQDNIVYKQGNYFVGIDNYGVRIRKDYKYVADLRASDLYMVRNSKSAFYHSNILFIHDKDGKLWSIKNPGLDSVKNRKNLLNEEKTLALFKDGDIDGLTIDSEKRLFLNGELQTLDIKTYFDYIINIKKHFSDIFNKKSSNNFYIRNNADFIGSDTDDNKYWYENNRVLVINKDGIPIDNILLTPDFMLPVPPAVSPSGDIYFMHHGEDKVTLYKIERQW